MTVSKNLSQTVKKLKTDFVDCSDFLLRELELDGARLAIAAADGMIDSLQLSQMVVSPIINSGAADFDTVKNSVVNSVELNEADDYNDCLYYIQSGFAVVFFDGDSRALCCGIQAPPARSVDEPANESTVKAPKEAFTEVLNTDKALLRKRLKTPHLKLKQLKLGIEIPSAVVVAYMDDRADRELVSCVIEALREARLDSVGDYGQLVKYIDTDIKTVFSAVSSTERPDVVASKLLEGRVAVLVDGSPFALYTPSLFTDNFRSPRRLRRSSALFGIYKNTSVFFIRDVDFSSRCLCRNRYISSGAYTDRYAVYNSQGGNNHAVFSDDRGGDAACYV